MRNIIIILILTFASCQQQPVNPSQQDLLKTQNEQPNQQNIIQNQDPVNVGQPDQPVTNQQDPIILEPQPNIQAPASIQPQVIQPLVAEPQQVEPSVVQQNLGAEVEPTIVDSNIQQASNPNQNSNNQQVNANQNYDQPDPERSAKYRQEQQRIREMRRKEQIAQKVRNYTRQNRPVSSTQQRKNRQRAQSRQAKSKISSGIPKKNVLFQIDRSIEQFIITPTADSQLFISLGIYTLENNAYSFIKDIQKAGVLRVYIYEDNARIVANGQFYFEQTLIFRGNAKSNYAVRFYNSGTPKLVTFSYPNILETVHLQKIYDKQKSVYHLWKTEELGVRVSEITQKLRMNSMMDRTNNEIMMNALLRYSGYQILQMFIVLIISGFQVHMVKRLFASDSIL